MVIPFRAIRSAAPRHWRRWKKPRSWRCTKTPPPAVRTPEQFLAFDAAGQVRIAFDIRCTDAGDGTVLAFSATGGLPENAVLIESSKKHQVLFDDPAVWQSLKPYLQR